MSPRSFLLALRRINAGVGLACGLVLLATCALILAEIVLRRVAFGLIGGTDEIAGYAMAGLASWSAAYALIERAHIRIDLLHRRLPPPGRTLLDVAALAGLLAVSLALTYHGWGVVSQSLARGATANTPLETPLWMPQALWLAGWVWFALASLCLLLFTLRAALAGDWAAAAAAAGPESEGAPE